MLEHPIAAIVLAAGKGTRMQSAMPKVLHKIAGQPMVCHVLDAVAPLNPNETCVVVGPGMDDVAAEVHPVRTVIQAHQNGTGDAVKVAMHELSVRKGTVLVLYGGDPLIRTETVRKLLAVRQEGASVVVLGFCANAVSYTHLTLPTKA